MIAHRLTTIASADNLLYFKSRSQLVSAVKGSAEYDEIFEKLKCIQYAYGDDDKEKEEEVEDDEEDIIEEEEDSDDDRIETAIAKLSDNSSVNAQDEKRKHSVQSEQDPDTMFRRVSDRTSGENKRINPSGPLDSQEFNLFDNRDRLLSDG